MHVLYFILSFDLGKDCETLYEKVEIMRRFSSLKLPNLELDVSKDSEIVLSCSNQVCSPAHRQSEAFSSFRVYQNDQEYKLFCPKDLGISL